MANLRTHLRTIFDGAGAETRTAEAIVFYATLFAALLFAAETVPAWDARYGHIFEALEWALTTLFTAEYLLRLYAAPQRLRYVFSLWGLIDLAATLPSLFLFGAQTTGFRALRLLRIFRLLKLLRLQDAGHRMAHAFRAVAPELAVFFCVASVLIYFAAFGIYIFEHDAQPDKFASIPHSAWWALITLTTVGYGDVYLITAGGKIFTGAILLIGLSIVAIPTGLFSAALIKIRSAENND